MCRLGDFSEVNEILMSVLDMALAYLATPDAKSKKYCLRVAAWEGVNELRAVKPELGEPFYTLVAECLRLCDTAEMHMPKPSASLPEYQVAATSLEKLALQTDRILADNPSLKVGISKKKLASSREFANIRELASRA